MSNDKHFLEAALQNLEATVDLLVDNELTRAIPVVGTAFKIAKGIDDLRSRALLAKLTAFVREPALCSDRSRTLLQERLVANPESEQRIGEALFLVLEQCTDLSKPAMLARVFSAYLRGEVNESGLRRMSHAIGIAFPDDLAALVNSQGDGWNSEGGLWMQPLFAAGLATASPGGAWDTLNRIDYRLSPLGQELRRLLQPM